MPDDRIEMGSTELPDVLKTLAGVLPQFEGVDLESQLQTYDTFLEMLAPSVRPQIASLLEGAAGKASVPASRERIQAAAEAVRQGGRAAEPYDHAKTMAAYQEAHRKAFPNAPLPEAAADPRGECDVREEQLLVDGKRVHPRLLAQLDLIEAELKRIGRWSGDTAAFQAQIERGEIKSFLDAPTFEMWLQVVFLPRARQASLDDTLPANSQVGEMARRQYDYMSVDDEAETLMHLLQAFDEMVIAAHV